MRTSAPLPFRQSVDDYVESFFARNIADVRPLFEWMPLLLIFLIFVAALVVIRHLVRQMVGC